MKRKTKADVTIVILGLLGIGVLWQLLPQMSAAHHGGPHYQTASGGGGEVLSSCTCVSASGSPLGAAVGFGPVTVYAGGRIALDPGASLDEDAKAFWYAVAAQYPQVCGGR